MALYTANAYSAEREVSASACTRCVPGVLRKQMRPIVTDGVASSVCHELCENGWTNRNAVWAVGPRKHVLGRVQFGATWRIRFSRPCAAAMRPYVKLLWPHVIIMARHLTKRSLQDIPIKQKLTAIR